jgi:hypothetical protein
MDPAASTVVDITTEVAHHGAWRTGTSAALIDLPDTALKEIVASTQGTGLSGTRPSAVLSGGHCFLAVVEADSFVRPVTKGLVIRRATSAKRERHCRRLDYVTILVLDDDLTIDQRLIHSYGR